MKNRTGGYSLSALHAGARQIESRVDAPASAQANAALEELVGATDVRRDKLPFETKIVTGQINAAAQGTHHLKEAA